MITTREMKYFKLEEFRCRCCGGLPAEAQENVRALVENVLDPARQKLGGPVTVNSGYRCAKHNREVGGVSASQHLRGEAADVAPAGFKISSADSCHDLAKRASSMVLAAPRVQNSGFKSALKDLANAIKENGRFDQLIIYPTFVHVSYRRNGGNRKEVLRKTAGGYQRVDAKSI